MPPRSSTCRCSSRTGSEGVKTNVFGSVNVADAAAAAGAAAMVMISTDKAIEPVSVLGATKRFAEMYCQALDAEHFARRERRQRRPMRLICGAVRQRAGVERLGGAEVQGADRGRRAGHRHASRHGALLHDHPRGLRSRRHGGEPRARPERSRRLGLCAQHGPAGEDRRSRRADDPAVRAGARPRHRIVFTGIRPGERLHEILFAREEPTARSASRASSRPSRCVRRSTPCGAGWRRWSRAWRASDARRSIGVLRERCRISAGPERRGPLSRPAPPRCSATLAASRPAAAPMASALACHERARHQHATATASAGEREIDREHAADDLPDGEAAVGRALIEMAAVRLPDTLAPYERAGSA